MINIIKEIDNKIINLIDNKFTCRKLDTIMRLITFLGDYGIVWSILILYFLYKKYTTLSLAMMYSLAITSLINEKVLKKIFKRTRPAIQNKYSNLIIKIPRSYSFPSGHTATAFSVVPLILMNGSKWIGIFSVCIACIIGFSRIYLKVHYFTDVVVGALLGITVSISTYLYIFA